MLNTYRISIKGNQTPVLAYGETPKQAFAAHFADISLTRISSPQDADFCIELVSGDKHTKNYYIGTAIGTTTPKPCNYYLVRDLTSSRYRPLFLVAVDKNTLTPEAVRELIVTAKRKAQDKYEDEWTCEHVISYLTNADARIRIVPLETEEFYI